MIHPVGVEAGVLDVVELELELEELELDELELAFELTHTVPAFNRGLEVDVEVDVPETPDAVVAWLMERAFAPPLVDHDQSPCASFARDLGTVGSRSGSP